MRLFVAVGLSERVKSELITACRPLRAAGWPLRWLPDSALHLTLNFIGEVSPQLAEKIESDIPLAAAATPSFVLRFRGLGLFAGGGLPRVLWAGVETSTTLANLQESLRKILIACGISLEQRDYHPHVTLGRGRGRPLPARAADILAERFSQDLGEMRVDAYRLYRSSLTSSGAIHTLIREVPLVDA